MFFMDFKVYFIFKNIFYFDIQYFGLRIKIWEIFRDNMKIKMKMIKKKKIYLIILEFNDKLMKKIFFCLFKM
jgi:hypothetical protein